MFSEAQRIKSLTGNSNINIENEAELLDLSNRYKALYTERDQLELQLNDAEREFNRVDDLFTDAELEETTKPEEQLSVSGIAPYSPLEEDPKLSPVLIPTRSPEELAVTTGKTGTLIDPNFDLADIVEQTQGISPLNLGIPTAEGLTSSGTGVDEIAEIDAGMQQADADSRGEGPPKIVIDPITEQLQGLKDGTVVMIWHHDLVNNQKHNKMTLILNLNNYLL